MDFDNPYPEESLLGVEFDFPSPAGDSGLPDASPGNQPGYTDAPTESEPKPPSKQESPNASPGHPDGQSGAQASVSEEKAPTGVERKLFYMLTHCWSNTGTGQKIENEARRGGRVSHFMRYNKVYFVEIISTLNIHPIATKIRASAVKKHLQIKIHSFPLLRTTGGFSSESVFTVKQKSQAS